MKIFQNNPNLKWIFLIAFIALNALFSVSGLFSIPFLFIVDLVIVLPFLLMVEIIKNTKIQKKRILRVLGIFIGLVLLIDLCFLFLLHLPGGNEFQADRLFEKLFFFSEFVIIVLPIFLGIFFQRSGSDFSFGIFAAVLVAIMQTCLEIYFDQFVDHGAAEGLWGLFVLPILLFWIFTGIGGYLVNLRRSYRFQKTS